MCGRFTLEKEEAEIIARFQINNQITNFKKRFNIAPGQQVLAIINDNGENRAGYLKWGLVPPWAKDPAIGNKMINARAETLAEKPSFRNAYKLHRCLIIADGFYEWKRDAKNKIPMFITMKNRSLFAFAGLYETFTNEKNQRLSTCTIITTKPNELVANLHDRMPVILGKEQERVWLNRSIHDTKILTSLLKPYIAEDMMAYQVSSLVNSPKNEGEELINRI